MLPLSPIDEPVARKDSLASLWTSRNLQVVSSGLHQRTSDPTHSEVGGLVKKPSAIHPVSHLESNEYQMDTIRSLVQKFDQKPGPV